MEIYEEKLTHLGLTRNQSKIYIALLQMGKATVREISKKIGFQRPNIYDILEELKEKGLVTYFQQGNSSYYQAVDPDNLIIMLKEKEEILNSILPELKKFRNINKEDVEVQIYKGEQGIKVSFNKILNFKSTILYGINVHSQLSTSMPIYANQFFRKREEADIKYKAIYTSKDRRKLKDAEIRYQKSESYNPTVTHIYENIVLIHIWHPVLIGIEIKSETIAEAYKKYFQTLWNAASKTPILS